MCVCVCEPHVFHCACVWVQTLLIVARCSWENASPRAESRRGKSSNWSFRLASNNWKSWLYVALEIQEKAEKAKKMRMRMRMRKRIQYPLRCNTTRILFVSFHWVESYRGRGECGGGATPHDSWDEHVVVVCASCRITISIWAHLTSDFQTMLLRKAAKRLLSSWNQAKESLIHSPFKIDRVLILNN